MRTEPLLPATQPFGPMVKFTAAFGLTLPLELGGTTIQLASLALACQAQVEVTCTVPLPPFTGKLAVTGKIEVLQKAADWITSTCVPATVIVALRSTPTGLRSAVKLTVPVPLPARPAVMCSQLTPRSTADDHPEQKPPVVGTTEMVDVNEIGRAHVRTPVTIRS